MRFEIKAGWKNLSSNPRNAMIEMKVSNLKSHIYHLIAFLAYSSRAGVVAVGHVGAARINEAARACNMR